MRYSNKAGAVLVMIAAWGLLSGCGRQAYRELATEEQNQTVTPGPTPTPTPSPSPSTTPLDPALEYNVTLIGSDSETVTVDTDRGLKVRITAGPSGGIVGNGTPAGYACASYQVTVGGRTVTTPTLKVPGTANNMLCPDAPTSYIIDFKDRLAPGHNTVDIKVGGTRTSARCQWCLTNYGGAWWVTGYGTCTSFCPLNANYDARSGYPMTGSAHIASALLEVQVDGTQFQ